MQGKKLSDSETFFEYCVVIKKMDSARSSCIELYTLLEQERASIHDRLLDEFGVSRDNKQFALYLATMVLEMTAPTSCQSLP